MPLRASRKRSRRRWGRLRGIWSRGTLWLLQRNPPGITLTYRRYRGELAPVVPIQVKAGRRWKRVWAYVDSGAAYSILSVAEARRLGLMKVKARRMAIATSGGRTHQISLHRLWVKLAGEKLSITFGVPRGFNVDFNLLGRRDLFRRYVVSFDDHKGLLTFTRHHRDA